MNYLPMLICAYLLVSFLVLSFNVYAFKYFQLLEKKNAQLRRGNLITVTIRKNIKRAHLWPYDFVIAVLNYIRKDVLIISYNTIAVVQHLTKPYKTNAKAIPINY